MDRSCHAQWIAFGVAGFAVGLLIAGCGDDGSGTGGASSVGGSSAGGSSAGGSSAGGSSAGGSSAGGSNAGGGGAASTGGSGGEGGQGSCGDGVLGAGEACDDGNAAADDGCSDCVEDAGFSCTGEPSVCTTTCGDGVLAGLEGCDDGNMVVDDGCDDQCQEELGYTCAGSPSLCAPLCGDGLLIGGEVCDDGNMIDNDGCTNMCAMGTVAMFGNSQMFVAEALQALQVSFSSATDPNLGMPGAAGIVIITNDGAQISAADYQASLDAGQHVLVIGGSGDPAYTAWVNTYIGTDGSASWHQSDSCSADFTKVGNDPMTALLPASYEFTDQTVSYHMLHLTAALPNTTLLGVSCEGADSYNYARRSFNQGTFTVMALDVGNYSDASSSAQFVQPFLASYLSYVRGVH